MAKLQKLYVWTINYILTFLTGAFIQTFFQPITDTNNNAPVFDLTIYEYNLPMPLPGQLVINGNFGPEIKAIDIDITNYNVSFEIEPAGDFTIEYAGLYSGDTLKKTHLARLLSAKQLTFTESKEYTLHVKVST